VLHVVTLICVTLLAGVLVEALVAGGLGCVLLVRKLRPATEERRVPRTLTEILTSTESPGAGLGVPGVGSLVRPPDEGEEPIATFYEFTRGLNGGATGVVPPFADVDQEEADAEPLRR